MAENSKACAFIDTLLRSFSQIILGNNALAGLIVLLSFIDRPVAGILALLASIAATVIAMLMGIDRGLVRSGLFGTSGALTGFAFSSFLPQNILLVPASIVAGGLCVFVTIFLTERLSYRHGLPIVGLPFLLVTWVGLLALRWMPEVPVLSSPLPAVFTGGWADYVLRGLLPLWTTTVFRTMSAMFLQDNVTIGVVCLVGILIHSRISFLFGLTSGVIAIALLARFAGPELPYIDRLIIGYNCALISIGLGGIFMVLTWQSALYAIAAAFVGFWIGLGFTHVLAPISLSPLAAAFSLVTLLSLYLVTRFPASFASVGLALIPLAQVARPEVNFNRRLLVHMSRHRQMVQLSLPFYGIWYVPHGVGSQFTHAGAGTYAWDFVVLDSHRRLCRGWGTENEDCYSFGLPILAPAPGIVVKVVNSVPDNRPPVPNWEQTWGNYLIIDHGNDEFSEISHCKQGSIVVKEAERVERGQQLALCGNSGLSLSAHIHYQLQVDGKVGAVTLPARFHDYIVHHGQSRTSVREGIPREREFISNASSQDDLVPSRSPLFAGR